MRTYHDARSSECQICHRSCNNIHVVVKVYNDKVGHRNLCVAEGFFGLMLSSGNIDQENL